MDQIQFNPFSPEFRTNPYPYYEMLRAKAPIFYWEAGNAWFLSSHEDCKNLLRDNRLGNRPGPGASMLFQNPPDHTRLRGLVQKAFTPRMIEKLREKTQEITNRLIDQVEQRGHMDLITEFATQVPVTVIAEMMGVPPADHIRFRDWSDALIRSLDLMDDPGVSQQANEADKAFQDYFQVLFDERRAAPKDDLLSALVMAEEAGDKLTEGELHTNSRLLLIAGYETTVNLIGNGVLALLNHPEQMKKLKAHPELIGTAVEEMLRYDSPIQMVGRSVLENVNYKGHEFVDEQHIGFLIGAANHDPAEFAAPDRFDITREHNPHFSFSHGIHYCLGAALARMEGQIAVNTLLRRLPNLRQETKTLAYRDNYVFRGLQELVISF